MIDHIKNSLEKANNNISRIDQGIIDMEGMSGTKTRHFYNNIVNIPDSRYLEIGSWKGSSFCAALCNNTINAVSIDNWSEFNGPKDEFLKNVEKYKGSNAVDIIEDDCFKIKLLYKFNIYMYDGNHTYDSHYKALTHFYEAMDNEFIYIVDDWNWEQVRNATNKAIEDLKSTVLYEKEIFTSLDNSTNPDKDWWNGMAVFLLKK